MTSPIVNTNNATDFSAIKKVILIDVNGYAINPDGTSSTIKVVDTQGGTDFSAVQPVIIINPNGQSI